MVRVWVLGVSLVVFFNCGDVFGYGGRPTAETKKVKRDFVPVGTIFSLTRTLHIPVTDRSYRNGPKTNFYLHYFLGSTSITQEVMDIYKENYCRLSIIIDHNVKEEYVVNGILKIPEGTQLTTSSLPEYVLQASALPDQGTDGQPGIQMSAICYDYIHKIDVRFNKHKELPMTVDTFNSYLDIFDIVSIP